MPKKFWDIEMNDLINVLTRTSGRPRFFVDCKKSIEDQTYKNVQQIISIDDNDSLHYVEGLNYIKVPKQKPKSKTFPGVGYATHNLYLNNLNKQVKDGWIMYLDDDDEFKQQDALEIIANQITSEDDLVIWRVDHKVKIIPEDSYWGKTPQYHHISMPGFMYHSKYKDQAIFDDLSWADYKVISDLYKIIPNKIWIDKVLTGVQQGRGRGKRKDKRLDL